MKKNTTLALTLGLLVAAIQAYAQDTNTNTTATTTFTVQDLNVALTGFAQGTDNGTTKTVTPVRISTKDIVSAVGGTATGRSKIIIATPTDGSAGSSFLLQTGTGKNVTITDVSGFFTTQTTLAAEKSTTSSSGSVTGTEYSVDQFAFGSTGDNGTPVSFNVQGFSTTVKPNRGVVSNVNGTGNVNGADAVLRGTIKVGAGRTQTIATP